MNVDYLTPLLNFEMSCLRNFDSYINDFANKVEIKIEPVSEKLSWLKVELVNSCINKKIEVSMSYGLNFENKIIGNCRFFIAHDNKSFSIKDYCEYKGIINPIRKDFFIGEELNQTEIEIYLNSCLSFLSIEEINRILYSDFWIDIPSDFSPYR